MLLIIQIAGGVLLALSAAGIAYTLAAALLVGWRLRARVAPNGPAAPVTFFKPLCGSDPELAENLESFLLQDYGAPVQMVLGVQDSADPALTAARAVQAEHAAEVDLVLDARGHGANRKVSNLINMAGRARHDLLVISDADIRVRPDYLARIAAALEAPGVGAATCYYFGQGREGFWSRLTAMGVSYGFMPNVVLGVALGMAQPCMGSTIALKRSVLERIGGFEAFKDVLADDYEIGRAVRGLGLKVVLPPMAVAHGCAERSFAAVIAQELRWAVTIRSLQPAGHLGSVVTHPVPLATLGALLLGAPDYALGLLATAVLARIGLMVAVDRAVGASSGPAPLLPVRDFVSFGVFICSLFVRSVDWRGARFRVSSRRRVPAA